MRFESKLSICARTAARIWQNADNEHNANNAQMPRPTNLRALMYCFTLCLQQHTCVLLTRCVIVCVSYVRVPISTLHQICAIRRLTVEFGAKKMWCLLFVAYGTARTIYVRILRLVVYMRIQTLCSFFGGLLRNRQFLKRSFTTAICDFMGTNQVFVEHSKRFEKTNPTISGGEISEQTSAVRISGRQNSEQTRSKLDEQILMRDNAVRVSKMKFFTRQFVCS